MTKQKISYFLVIALYFITTVAVFAQDEFPEDDEGPEGPPPAPIDQFTIVLAIIGIVFAWQYFKKIRLAHAKLKQSHI